MIVRLIGHEESFEVRYTFANEPTFVDNAAKLIRCDLFRPAEYGFFEEDSNERHHSEA
jgi:hypothetical protein